VPTPPPTTLDDDPLGRLVTAIIEGELTESMRVDPAQCKEYGLRARGGDRAGSVRDRGRELSPIRVLSGLHARHCTRAEWNTILLLITSRAERLHTSASLAASAEASDAPSGEKASAVIGARCRCSVAVGRSASPSRANKYMLLSVAPTATSSPSGEMATAACHTHPATPGDVYQGMCQADRAL